MSEAEVIPELPAIRKGGAAPVHVHATEGEEEVVIKPHWYRSTLTQILIVGGVFFCSPGMYNALNSLGAGGLATPWYANATAAAGYVFMAFMCICGGILVSKIGLRKSLIISTTGDIIYAGSLYLNSKNGTQWFLMLGSIYSGITDGLMYAVEGAIITAYPEPSRRGRMLSLWVFMRSAAPVVGGAIIFGVNFGTNSSGGVSLKTYLVIIGIMCAGPFIAINLSPPKKVQRIDGKSVVFRKTSFRRSMKEWFVVVSHPKMWLLFPLFFTSWFYGSYIGTLETQYFNVRTRALTAFVSPFGDIIGGLAIGYFLDYPKLTKNQKARWSFIFLMSLNLGLWIWTAVITKWLEDHQPSLDWSDKEFGRMWAPQIMFEFTTMATQSSLYWMVSFLSSDMNTLSYITGSLRGVECAGQAVAYGIKSTDSSDWISIGLNVGLFVISIPPAWMVIKDLGKEGVDNRIGIDLGKEGSVESEADAKKVAYEEDESRNENEKSPV